jgi:hypothetical protein
LTINYAGNGSGSVTTAYIGTLVVPPSTYAYGTVVTLTAVPNSTSSFAGWSGAVSGLTNPITLTMDSNKIVTATFNLLGPTYYLEFRLTAILDAFSTHMPPHMVVSRAQ